MKGSKLPAEHILPFAYKSTFMSYVLKAVIALKSDLKHYKRRTLISVVDLPQSYCLLPLTNELLALIHNQSALHSRIPEFMYLEEAVITWLIKHFGFGTFALVENDTFGGVGEQSSLVWRDGKYVFGPKHTETDICEPYSEQNIPLDNAAINQALRSLGVVRGTKDEFGTLGLDKYRDTKDWILRDV